MRKIFYISLITLLGLSSISCSSTVDFTVNGRPGTIIYSPTNQQLATIEHNGKAKVKIDRKKFYPYLLSKSANAEEPIPFALNFKGKSYTGHEIAAYTAYTVSLLGSGVAIASGISAAKDDSDTKLPAIALGAALAGALTGLPITFYLDNVDANHGFKYEKQQYTNEDLYLDLSPRTNNNNSKKQDTGNKKDKNKTTIDNKTQEKANEAFIHTAKQGETLKSIAEMYDVSVKDLIKWNNKKSNTVKAGEKIKIYY